MVRKKTNTELLISFEKNDWQGNWARRVMTVTKEIPGYRYNHQTKQWSIPLQYEELWRKKIDSESVEYWSNEDYDEWLEDTFGE